MRALLRLLVALPFGLLVILFAVSNRQMIPVTLDPLPGAVDLPLALLVLGTGLLGFVLGGLVVWVGQGRHRRLAREARRKMDALSAEVAGLRLAKAPPPPESRSANPPGTSLIAH